MTPLDTASPDPASPGVTPGLTGRLADFVVATRTEDLSEDLFARAADGVVDTLGVAVAGARGDQQKKLLAWLGPSGRPEAGVFGTGLRLSAEDAALVNATAAHVLDFDDGLEGMHGHPSAVLVPVVLALGEVTGASGRDVLAAYAIGVEIAATLGRAFGYRHYLRGWHKTSTVGIFAAAAAAARLLGLDAAALCTAWGLAASQMGGLTANFGTMTKSLNPGLAARNAIASASLARLGVTAHPAIFDGPGSVLATCTEGDGVSLDTLIAALGAPWALEAPGLSVKRWPCCYTSHRPVAGVQALVARHAIAIADIEAIEIEFLPGSDVALVCRRPQTGLEGLVSVEYAVAAMLLDGDLTLDSFSDTQVQRPQAQALIGRVRRTVAAVGGVHSWRDGEVGVAVATPRGRFATAVRAIPGTADRPMTQAEQAAKFLACVTPCLGAARAEFALAHALGLGDAVSVDALVASLTTRDG
jgi:2-methylcitrate dehydratase PrpD